MESAVKVKMLGKFSIEFQGRTVDDSSNRTKKVWLVLAYLIYNRRRRTTQEHYLSLLKGDGEEDSADPGGKLKAIFYRARTMLKQLDEETGRDWILHKNGTYLWNPEIPVELDVEEFETLCKAGAAAADDEVRLEKYLGALALYSGDLLPKLGMNHWVMPSATYYHQLYLDTVLSALILLEQRQRWQEALALGDAALKLEPYSEELYQHRMRCRTALGDRTGALRAYEDMSELLFSNFGVMPSEESRALYREAAREDSSAALTAGAVRENLREPEGERGAMYCEYDFFRTLYQLQARSIGRTGDVIHIALFSVHPKGQKPLSKTSLDRAMDNLQSLVLNNLRQGDVVTRCSVSQLIIMLPQANYENSCAVCQRLLRAFYRQYPHAPVDVHTSVQPLEPWVPKQKAKT